MFALPVPLARTLPPLTVHPTYAVLVGVVDARNGVANFKFEWGQTKRYGHAPKLSSEEYVTGSGFKKVAEVANRLRRGTTYHYRIVASNRSGVAFGRDRTFTTPGRPHVAG